MYGKKMSSCRELYTQLCIDTYKLFLMNVLIPTGISFSSTRFMSSFLEAAVLGVDMCEPATIQARVSLQIVLDERFYSYCDFKAKVLAEGVMLGKRDKKKGKRKNTEKRKRKVKEREITNSISSLRNLSKNRNV